MNKFIEAPQCIGLRIPGLAKPFGHQAEHIILVLLIECFAVFYIELLELLRDEKALLAQRPDNEEVGGDECCRDYDDDYENDGPHDLANVLGNIER